MQLHYYPDGGRYCVQFVPDENTNDVVNALTFSFLDRYEALLFAKLAIQSNIYSL